jgi:hypothetical protein
MKRFILFTSLVFLAIGIYAQPPQLIPYQAIARDNSGNPVLNQNIGLRFSIHDQTLNGAVVWQEAQTVVSNNLGIIVTALGGTSQLTSVDWGSGAKFLQVEMDIAGGSNYLDMGTQQMMSVPYALYAETSGSVINNGGGGNGSFTHWIGELYGGGIICHLWKDAQGVEHGLIASLVDLYSVNGMVPYAGHVDGINANFALDGLANSILISNNSISNFGPSYDQYAVALCMNYVVDGFDDWYLPAIREVEYLQKNLFELNNQLALMSNANIIGSLIEDFEPKYYFSSTTFNGTGISSDFYTPNDGEYCLKISAKDNGNIWGAYMNTSSSIVPVHIANWNSFSPRTRAFRKF